MVAIPIRKECVPKNPIFGSVCGPSKDFMIWFILYPVSGVPASNLNNGKFGSLAFNCLHFLKAFTGQIFLEFW